MNIAPLKREILIVNNTGALEFLCDTCKLEIVFYDGILMKEA